jgi:hypothetical protein
MAALWRHLRTVLLVALTVGVAIAAGQAFFGRLGGETGSSVPARHAVRTPRAVAVLPPVSPISPATPAPEPVGPPLAAVGPQVGTVLRPGLPLPQAVASVVRPGPLTLIRLGLAGSVTSVTVAGKHVVLVRLDVESLSLERQADLVGGLRHRQLHPGRSGSRQPLSF